MNEALDTSRSDQSVRYSVQGFPLAGFIRWVLISAIGIGLLVLLVPIVILCIAAVIVGLVVAIAISIAFFLLRLVLASPLMILGAVFRQRRQDDGRRNVRVIVRN